MKVKLFSYNQLDTFIHKLSGSSKLISFIILTFAVMLTYDPRVILGIMIFSFILVYFAKLPLKQLAPMFAYIAFFLIFNFVMNFIVASAHGAEVYGTKHVLFKLFGLIEITQEELFYQITKTLKYLATIPIGFIFFLTTNPSEFASSLNRIKVSYKICTAVSLTLRYFPDVARDFTDISNAQQARGLDNSKKAPLKQRVVNTTKIIIPLMFSTLDRIESISNAMELRGYGKHKTRTWYSSKKYTRNDYLSILVSILVLAISLFMRFFIVKNLYYNPFI